MSSSPPAAPARAATAVLLPVAVTFVLALAAAWFFPTIDHEANPDATTPGLISYLGVGLSVLVLTVALLYAGLRAVLPRTAVFLGAAIGYNALVVLVKFGLGPLALFASSQNNGFWFLNGSGGLFAFPGVAAITAVLYGIGFFLIYAYFHSSLRRRLGIKAAYESRFVGLFVTMFVIACVGGITIVGFFGFLEYAFSLLYIAVIGVLIALALTAAVILCSVAFAEARDQAVLLRNVTVLSTFAWIGLAFIAAYHIVWLVFILTMVSIWPLRSVSAK